MRWWRASRGRSGWGMEGGDIGMRRVAGGGGRVRGISGEGGGSAATVTHWVWSKRVRGERVCKREELTQCS